MGASRGCVAGDGDAIAVAAAADAGPGDGTGRSHHYNARARMHSRTCIVNAARYTLCAMRLANQGMRQLREQALTTQLRAVEERTRRLEDEREAQVRAALGGSSKRG